MMLCRFFCFITFVLLLVSTATAGEQPGAFTISPMVGGHSFDSDQNLEVGRFGALGLGYNLSDKAALEAVFSHTDVEGEQAGASDAKVTSYRIDALYYFISDRSLAPYLAIGFGGIELDPADGSGNHHFSANAGGGIKYFIDDNISLRADIRYLHTFSEPDKNLLYSAGLVFHFGSPPAATSAAVVE